MKRLMIYRACTTLAVLMAVVDASGAAHKF